MRDPSVPVLVEHVGTAPCKRPGSRGRASVEQVYRARLWEDGVRTMLEMGVTAFVEIGPGPGAVRAHQPH